MSSPATDILLYLFCAAIMVAAGVGFIAVLQLELDRCTHILLAPVAAQALWANALGFFVTGKVPVNKLAGPIWLATGALALWGCWWWRQGKGFAGSKGIVQTASSRVWLVGTCLVLPLLVLLPYVVYGFAQYPGSRHPDGWSYAAYGQYLWAVPRGAEGGLTPLHQYASHVANTRHVSSSELALLSGLTIPGDTQSATGTFLTLGFFVFASACAAVARVQGLSNGLTLLFLVMTVLSGWSLNILIVDNYDNLLALTIFPGLVAATLVMRPFQVGWWILLGLLVSALLYSYPDLGFVACGPWVVILGQRLFLFRESKWLTKAVLGLVPALLLLSPYAATMTEWLRHQVTAGFEERVRPGQGLFAGLLSLRSFPSAFWALGGEHEVSQPLVFGVLVGLILFCLLAVGLLKRVRSRDWGMLALLLLPLIAAPWFLVSQEYSYAAYKMIVIGWWAVTLVVVSSVTVIGRAATWRGVVIAVAVIACLAPPTVATARIVKSIERAPEGMDRFRAVTQVGALVGDEPIGIFVEDAEASQWAVYFLRNYRIKLGDFRGYLAMPHVRPLLDRAGSVPWNQVQLVLTDAVDPGPVVESQGWSLVWQGATYRLWNTGKDGWAIVTEVSTPNGIERYDDEPFFWMGGGPTTFRLIAREARCLQVDADVRRGPGLKLATSTVTLEASSGAREAIELSAGHDRFVLPVDRGVNDIVLTPNDTPVTPSSGDPRTLIVGLSGVTTSFRWGSEATVRLLAIDNPSGMETFNSKPFFWLGNSPAELWISADARVDVAISAEVIPGPSVERSVSTRRLRISEPAQGKSQEVSVQGGTWRYRMQVQSGQTLVRLEALDAPTIPEQPNGDRRPLIIGFSDLRVESGIDSAACR